jgi:colicin import membrane protein
MGMTESSALFSLQELARMEEERVRAQARAESAAQEAARRAAHEAEVRLREAAEAEECAREEARRSIERQAREEAARVQAIRDAAAEAARAEAFARVQAEERRKERQHAIEMTQVQATARGSRRTAALAGCLGAVLAAGVGMAVHFGVAAPSARAAIAEARSETASRDQTVDQLRIRASASEARERALQVDIAALREENTRLRADLDALRSRVPSGRTPGRGTPQPRRPDRTLDGFTTCPPGVNDPMCLH